MELNHQGDLALGICNWKCTAANQLQLLVFLEYSLVFLAMTAVLTENKISVSYSH